MALDLTELTKRHTGDYIFEVFSEVLQKHKLSKHRTLRVVTDCGSNVISAFQ